MRTSFPFSRWERAKMSDGTPKPATWPMWRGPLAYGHATATRIRCFCAPDSMAADDTAERSDRSPAEEREQRCECDQDRCEERDVPDGLRRGTSGRARPCRSH